MLFLLSSFHIPSEILFFNMTDKESPSCMFVSNCCIYIHELHKRDPKNIVEPLGSLQAAVILAALLHVCAATETRRLQQPGGGPRTIIRGISLAFHRAQAH